MKTFVALGMHRSATSLLAKGLALSAVHMGETLLGSSPCNPQGHFENVDIMHLNQRILKQAGGNWRNPPPEDAILQAGLLLGSHIAARLRDNQRSPYWGWKDPRTTLTIRCYLPYLTNPHFMCAFREPAAVAESLYRRDKMPLAEGLALAKTYNRRLLRFLSEWTEAGYYYEQADDSDGADLFPGYADERQSARAH